MPAPPLWCLLELPTRPTPEPTGLRWPAAVPSRIRDPLLSGLATYMSKFECEFTQPYK